MTSKYDINTLMEHYPLSRFFDYVKSQQDLNNDSHLQGLPTYDVYGLTKNNVVDYLCKKVSNTFDHLDSDFLTFSHACEKKTQKK